MNARMLFAIVSKVAVQKLLRYFLVGSIAALVDLVLFALGVRALGIPWYQAASVSFIAATLVNYVLSTNHVFESGIRFGKNHEIALVFLISSVGLGINQAALYLLGRLLGWDLMISKIVATCSVFIWNFVMRYRFVFSIRDKQVLVATAVQISSKQEAESLH